MLKIGELLSARWVAISFRTVPAVSHDCESLCKHLDDGRSDKTRSKCEQSGFQGLRNRMTLTQSRQDSALSEEIGRYSYLDSLRQIYSSRQRTPGDRKTQR